LWGKGSSEDDSKIIAPSGGSVLLFEQLSNALFPVYSPSDFSQAHSAELNPSGDAVDPQLSPKGNAVAFVINDDLYYLPLPSLSSSASSAPLSSPEPEARRQPIRLTDKGIQKGISCGLADYLAQEELDRYR